MRWFILFLLFLSAGIRLSAQDFSNRGKDFWIGYGNHFRMLDDNAQRMSLYITSAESTTGTIEIPGINFTTNFSVTANSITEVAVPNSAALLDEGLYDLGIHVTAQKNVVVYSHIYDQAVSGATVCLPTPTLGLDYISVNYTQRSNSEQYAYSWFFVLATEDNTTVEIIPAAASKGGLAAGVPILRNLNRGQIFQVLSKTDLTGSVIRSINNGSGCKKVAVYSGSGKISIGCSGQFGSSDNLYQQLYPTNTWGKKYVLLPSAVRSLNYFRIIKKDPGTVVRINGTVVPDAQFVNNLYHEFSTSSTAVVEADKPILTAQYFTTQSDCNLEPNVNGDPEMIFLNPVEQTLKDATLYSSSKYQIQTHYINVVLPSGGTAVSSFTLDGQSVASQFAPLPQDPNFSYARLQVSAGTHNIRSDSGFNAIAYGFGNRESYGYSAGTNLVDLHQFISIKNPYNQVNVPATCRNSPFYCSITLPYEPNKIHWKFNGLFPDISITSPVADRVYQYEGRTLYEYHLADEYQVNSGGTYNFKVLVDNPTADGCSGEQEIDFELTVYDKPVADFSISKAGICSKDSFDLKDLSDGKSRAIQEWIWDLGDGSHSAKKDLRHAYPTDGNYTITLQAVNDIGCISDPVQRNMEVYAIPVASFSPASAVCSDRNLSFINQSTVANAAIQESYWNWGDGHTEVSTATTVTHNYAADGTYKFELSVVSDKGCKSDTLKTDLVVHPNPVADFVLPENCIDDVGAKFFSSASMPGDPGAALTHRWAFGDPLNSTSTDKDPLFKYNAAGLYDVKLEVEAVTGCKSDIIQKISINGSIPSAGFSFVTPTFCDNAPIAIRDESSVDIGQLVRTEIYWDYNNDPLAKTVDEDPEYGRVYTYKYPPLVNQLSRTVRVRYVVYSGEQCVSQTDRDFELKAGPALAGKTIISVCAEAAPFAITEWSDQLGFPGTASFSGTGVTTGGVFNPAITGPGDHSLNYRYVTTNGCFADTNFIVRVHPTPIVDAGPDQFVLDGGVGRFEGRGTGNDLQFTWSPQIGIDPTSSPSVVVVHGITDREYTLRAESAEGCVAEDKVKLIVLLAPEIPNAFSPNGDGINDTWQISALNSYPNAKVEVFNRFGQSVYRSSGYNRPWDGRVNGKLLPPGTYYYLITPGNGRKPYKGTVTLIY